MVQNIDLPLCCSMKHTFTFTLFGGGSRDHWFSHFSLPYKLHSPSRLFFKIDIPLCSSLNVLLGIVLLLWLLLLHHDICTKSHPHKIFRVIRTFCQSFGGIVVQKKRKGMSFHHFLGSNLTLCGSCPLRMPRKVSYKKWWSCWSTDKNLHE